MQLYAPTSSKSKYGLLSRQKSDQLLVKSVDGHACRGAVVRKQTKPVERVQDNMFVFKTLLAKAFWKVFERCTTLVMLTRRWSLFAMAVSLFIRAIHSVSIQCVYFSSTLFLELNVCGACPHF